RRRCVGWHFAVLTVGRSRYRRVRSVTEREEERKWDFESPGRALGPSAAIHFTGPEKTPVRLNTSARFRGLCQCLLCLFARLARNHFAISGGFGQSLTA